MVLPFMYTMMYNELYKASYTLRCACLLFIAVVLSTTLGCSTKYGGGNDITLDIISNPEKVLKMGVEAYNRQDYKEAIRILSKIEDEYPLSELNSRGFKYRLDAMMKSGRYAETVIDIDSFLLFDPVSDMTTMLLYSKAMAYYHQIQDCDRDISLAHDIIKIMNVMEAEYPDDEYTKMLSEKREVLNNTIVSYAISTALYHMSKNNLIGAMNILDSTIKHHEGSKLVPEMMYRIIECYHALGIECEVERYLSMISDSKYNGNIWQKKAIAMFSNQIAQ